MKKKNISRDELLKAKEIAYHDLIEEDDFIWEDTFLPDDDVLKIIEDGEDKSVPNKDEE